MTEDQRKRNARLGWILAAVAVALYVGFFLRRIWLQGH